MCQWLQQSRLQTLATQQAGLTQTSRSFRAGQLCMLTGRSLAVFIGAFTLRFDRGSLSECQRRLGFRRHAQ